ncbi:putative Receptor protein kinase CLAVATA1 precursor [Corchorus olitorius]|uniref:Receptor protein kinase CLAVATA1 n=1 Tax=Corchorus olitorius TaxID=93759 RepID=A0A1R3IX76_9ROSI|nr:putative Receptor protein kinase CLAVATA1 precursor [Corchorus olitorius]
MNELTGEIPTGLCGLQLGSFNLLSNRLEGTLPESITHSRELYELKLFNKKLSMPLPTVSWVGSQMGSGEYPEFSCLSWLKNPLDSRLGHKDKGIWKLWSSLESLAMWSTVVNGGWRYGQRWLFVLFI